MPDSLEQEIRTLQSIFWSERDPEGLVFASLADAFRRKGEVREALDLLTDGMSRHPEYATGHVIATKLYRDQGMSSEAEISARRVLELDAENLVALSAMTSILAEKGELDEAARHRTLLMSVDPESDEARAVADLDLEAPAVEASDPTAEPELTDATAEPELESGEEVDPLFGDLTIEPLPDGSSGPDEDELAAAMDTLGLTEEASEDGPLAAPETEVAEIASELPGPEVELPDLEAIGADEPIEEAGEAIDFGGMEPEPGDTLDLAALAPDAPEAEDTLDITALAPDDEDEVDPAATVDLASLAPDEPEDTLDITTLAPDEPEDTLDIATLAPDEPEDTLDIATLAPDDEEEVDPPATVDLASLAPDEPEDTLDITTLAPDEPEDTLDIATLAPDEPDDEEEVLDLAALAPDQAEDTLDIATLAPHEPEAEDALDVAALAPDADEVELSPVAPDEPALHGEDGDAGDGDEEVSEPIYTRTLAELYIKQGFTDKALEVLEALYAMNPHATDLAERIEALKTGELDEASFPGPPSPPAGPPETSSGDGHTDDEVETRARELAEQGQDDADDVDTPFAWGESDETAAESDSEAVGESAVGSYFDALLGWERRTES